MKKSLYRFFVYFTLTSFLLCLGFFIMETALASDLNGYAILCLVLSILSLIGFVVNQILYRRFKIRDEERYAQVECPHCHTMNPKKELFCKKCGRNLH